MGKTIVARARTKREALPNNERPKYGSRNGFRVLDFILIEFVFVKCLVYLPTPVLLLKFLMSLDGLFLLLILNPYPLISILVAMIC